MRYLYNFGLSQEDERTEAAALALPGGRVLSIASAGDMPLSLLALGADDVAAADIDANQLHLTRLKLAAVLTLDRTDALAFLGYLPASAAARRAWLRRASPMLPEDARAFWLRHVDFVEGGAIWAGRYERFLRRLQLVLRPLFSGAIEALIGCDTIEEQAEVFARRLDTPLLRGAFRICFHPAVFSSRGMDPRSLRYRKRTGSLGERYFQRFRTLCVATPAASNYLLHLHLLGRLVSADAGPAYLEEAGAARIRRAPARLRLVHADVRRVLQECPPASFDKVHLSNLPDWVSQVEFEAVLHALSRAVAPGGRIAWRYLHVERTVPPELQPRIRPDPALGARLGAADRFPFYEVVAAEIHSPVAVSA